MESGDGSRHAGRPAGGVRRAGLVLLRHGQSTSNAADVFTGWSDVPLTCLGRAQAVQAGRLLVRAAAAPTSVHTSLLRRAISTAEIATAELGLSWLPVYRSWRLNERHYGALTGRPKADVAAEVAPEVLRAWRRSFSTAPPAMPAGSAHDVSADPRYAGLPVPRTESLADVWRRLEPYWADVLAAEIHRGGTPLVVAHGNTLRALVKHLDGLDDHEVAGLDIPTGVPMFYALDAALRPVPAAGSRYLDPLAAQEPVRTGPP